MKNIQNKWIRWTSLLLVTAFCVGLITPAASMAAPAHPQETGSSSYLPMLRNNVCRGKLPTSNPIGTQIYGNTGYGELHFQLLQNTRSSWIRNSISWADIEPVNMEEIHYNWAHSDARLQAAKDNCANMIVTVDYTPEWASIGGYRSPIRTEYLNEYADFIRALVERYDGDGTDDAPGGIVVNHWEFYNEPDFGPHEDGGGWGEYGARYAEMLAVVHPVVHAANPNAKVVFGGIAYNYFTTQGGLFIREFLDNVLAADGGKYFDIMNIHHYPFPNNRENWTESNSSGLVEKIADVKAKLEAHNLSKPLMVTEIGWHSDNNDLYPSSDDFQGRHVVQLLTQAVAGDAMAAIWWAFYDTDYPYKTGLTVPPNTRKDSYDVYREAVTRIGTANFVQPVLPPSVDNDLEIYEFTEAGTNKTFYIAWLNPIAPFNAEAVASFDDSTTQAWQASGETATIYNKEGDSIGTVTDGEDGSDDGKITVQVGRNPIYIVIN